jgi:hypothetical protein
MTCKFNFSVFNCGISVLITKDFRLIFVLQNCDSTRCSTCLTSTPAIGQHSEPVGLQSSQHTSQIFILIFPV